MGLALIWKPKGVQSQRFLGDFHLSLGASPKNRRKKVGHSGTLDPFAEGLLLCGWAEGTKILSAVGGLSKSYEVEMLLGVSTESLDTDSEYCFPSQKLSPDAVSALRLKLEALDEGFLAEFLKNKRGQGLQVPPQLSSIKIGGESAHRLVRRGKSVDLPERSFEILAAKHLTLEAGPFEGSRVWRFSVEVSAGTYIRALARDWGEALLGFPGTLLNLKRYGIGPWTVECGSKCPKILNLEGLSPVMQTLKLDADECVKLRNGQWPRLAASGAAPVKSWILLAPGSLPLGLIRPEDKSGGRIFNADPFDLRVFEKLHFN